LRLISYLFYLPAERQKIFAQQLRLLEAREDLSECEAVVVWHGQPGIVNLSAFKSSTIDSIDCQRYNKSMLVNRAVKLSKGDVLIILDSDRIMPPDYFKKSVEMLKPKSAIAPQRMIKILSPIEDKEIWEMRFPYKRDDRTEKLTPFRKHLFSGNTIVYKEDYLAAGGMDETYWGYGFNDLDFTRAWEKSGFGIHWTDAEEIHLYHPRLDEKNPEDFHSQNVANAYKFFKKWNEPIPDKFSYDIAKRVVPLL